MFPGTMVVIQVIIGAKEQWGGMRSHAGRLNLADMQEIRHLSYNSSNQ